MTPNSIYDRIQNDSRDLKLLVGSPPPLLHSLCCKDVLWASRTSQALSCLRNFTEVLLLRILFSSQDSNDSLSSFPQGRLLSSPRLEKTPAGHSVLFLLCSFKRLVLRYLVITCLTSVLCTGLLAPRKGGTKLVYPLLRPWSITQPWYTEALNSKYSWTDRGLHM